MTAAQRAESTTSIISVLPKNKPLVSWPAAQRLAAKQRSSSRTNLKSLAVHLVYGPTKSSSLNLCANLEFSWTFLRKPDGTGLVIFALDKSQTTRYSWPRGRPRRNAGDQPPLSGPGVRCTSVAGGAGWRSAAGHAASGAGGLYPIEAWGLIVCSGVANSR